MDRDESIGPSDEVDLAAAGYRFYSDEALEFAAASAQAFFDVIIESDPIGWQDIYLDGDNS